MTRQETIEMLSEMRSGYNCFDDSERRFYDALSVAIEALESQERQELIVGSYLIEEPSCSENPNSSDLVKESGGLVKESGDLVKDLVKDIIYRQDMIDELHKHFGKGFYSDEWWNSTHVLTAIQEVSSAQPELIEKAAYIRGFEQGRTQGMIDSKGGKK